MSMAQLFASGFSAAVAGVVVNAAGLASGESIAAVNWLYGLFALVPLVAIPITWSVSQRDRVPLHQAAQ